MPPDQPDEPAGHSKRHRRPRSLSMTYSSEIIDVSDSSEPGASGSRKHGRHEKDTQVQGPNKRRKQNRGSEPPMRKDTTTTPKAKRKKSRKKVDHHKVPRTNNHQVLKEENKNLELGLKNARQAHEDDNREHQANLDWHARELKLLQDRCNEQATELRGKELIVEAQRDENQALKHKLKDTAKAIEALHSSCQEKDEKLKRKDEVIVAKQQDLDDSKYRSASFEESLAEADLALNGKDELLVAKQKELDDSKQRSELLSERLANANLTIMTQDEVIAGLKQELGGSKHQSASLEKALATLKLELRAKDEVITTNQKELEDSRERSSALEKSLVEKERSLKAAKRDQSDCRTQLALRDEKLSSTELERDQTKAALEIAQNEKESLHVINEGNGHRNHALRMREKKAKDAFKSLETEHKDKMSFFEAEKTELQTQCTELQADLDTQENEKNKMINKFQNKLKALRQHSQHYNYKEPDEKIKKDFANLESKIRQFVDDCARPVLNATDQELERVWPKWTPELRNFLASPLLCNQVLEAYVWECLVARIFTPGSNFWGGDLGRHLEMALCMAADETAQAELKSDLFIDFQYLRASASSLVGRLNCAEFRPKYFASDVKTMTSTLAKFCRLNGIDDSMEADAMDIFEDARKFEMQLRRLKATYTIRMCKLHPEGQELKYGFQFADEEMDYRSPRRDHDTSEQAPSVDFIVCPGLDKRGNNSGTNYEAKTCLIKMGVVCNATDLIQNLRPSTPAQSISTRAQKAHHSSEVKQPNQGSTPRNQAGSAASKAKRGTSFSNPLHIKGEETDLQQDLDPLSTRGLTSGSPARKVRDASQMQSGMTTNVMTRSQGQPNTNTNVHDGKSSAKQANNKLHPVGPAKGRGGGSSGKKTRNRKPSDPDADYNSESTV